MPEALPKKLRDSLRPLEEQLQACVKTGNFPKAKRITSKIVQLMADHKDHHRLLYAKLRCFETAVEANSIAYASAGLTGIRAKASDGTRLHLEASALLAICELRDKNIDAAKRLIRYVLDNINDIASDSRRHEFQKRIIERVEEECILTELIGTGTDKLDSTDIHERAVVLVKEKSNDEIFALIGESVPDRAIILLRDVRNDAVSGLSPSDRKFLPPATRSGETTQTRKTRICCVTPHRMAHVL